MEGIDTKDTESRLKLNKKLGTKFNRDVSDKTYEIKEQVGDCEGFGCADSLSQRRNRRAEREKAAADVGCVFGVRVFADHRGIVRARVLPVWFARCFVVMGVCVCYIGIYVHRYKTDSVKMDYIPRPAAYSEVDSEKQLHSYLFSL